MPTFTSISAYQAYNRRRANMIKVNGDKSATTAARFVASLARAKAPHSSGKLKTSIRRRKNVVSAHASSHNGFPYIHWVNQTTGKNMEVLDVKPKGKQRLTFVMIDGLSVFVPGGKMIYGSAPSNWKWTGEAGFFKKSVFAGRKLFRNTAIKATRKGLRAEAI